MEIPEINNASQLMSLIEQVGFLPLLNSGISGFSAEDLVAEECRYVANPDGGWDWPLWKWKGGIVREGICMYGKFFNKKAGFVSKEFMSDFINYRRSVHPYPSANSIEEAILATLGVVGSAITRELRAACGFNGAKMRSKFDSYLTNLQMGCYVVTEDFIYPRDKHGNDYGWGWSLLTTPERLYGLDVCQCNRTPQESYDLLFSKLHSVLPHASEQQIARILK